MLENKGIVVTGSGRGLGRATALALARHGARVVVNDIDGELAQSVVDEINAAGGDAISSSDSVADPAGAGALIERCVSEYGRIDGLVNNAAVVVDKPVWETTAQDVSRLVDVNLKGVFHCGIPALQHMRAQRSGVVLNITSRAALGWPSASVYSATKGAVISATQSWALDMAPYGVRVLGLAPTAQTRMSLGRTSDADPGDIALLIVYLMSERAAAASGQIFRYSGSVLSALMPARFDEPAVSRDYFTLEQLAEAVEDVIAPTFADVGVGSVNLRDVARPI